MRDCTVELIPVLKDNYVFVLHDNLSKKTAIIDPSVPQPVLDFLTARRWNLDAIWNTHHHPDHTGGNLDLKAATGCKIIAAQYDSHRIPGWDQLVKSDELFKFGNIDVMCKHIPGHTTGHIAFHIPQENLLFCGDTLFSLGCGKLFEGTAEQMWASLQWIKSLPTETQIYCNHEYTLDNARFALTIEPENPELVRRLAEAKDLRQRNRSTIPVSLGQELATNPFLRVDQAVIRRFLNLADAPEAAVFACLRRLKDEFGKTPLDRQYLFTRHENDRELMSELLDLFVPSSTQLLDEMQTALTRGDRRGLAVYAHSLKGAAANFAATLCTPLASDLEKTAESGDAADLQHTFLRLKVETRQLIFLVRENLAEA